MPEGEVGPSPLVDIVDLPEYRIRINVTNMVFAEPPEHAKYFLRSHFIRYYLKDIAPSGDYGHHMFQIWKAFLASVNQSRAPSKRRCLEGGNYQSFRNAMYVLKTIGFIREVPPLLPVEEVKTAFPRVIYRIVTSNLNHPGWHNPHKLWRELKAAGTLRLTGKPACAPTLTPAFVEAPKKPRTTRKKVPKP
jgi:hypothetical protein